MLHGGTKQDPQDGTGEVERLIDLVSQHGGTAQVIQDLPEVLAWNALQLDFMHPRSPTSGGPYSTFELNDNSVVMRLTCKERSVLFAADIERAAEALIAPRLATTDILKVPHHGNQDSSTQDFLDRVKPIHAVISSGIDNPYGVPHAAALARLQAPGRTVWRTSEVGHIRMQTSGERWDVLPFTPEQMMDEGATR